MLIIYKGFYNLKMRFWRKLKLKLKETWWLLVWECIRVRGVLLILKTPTYTNCTHRYSWKQTYFEDTWHLYKHLNGINHINILFNKMQTDYFGCLNRISTDPSVSIIKVPNTNIKERASMLYWYTWILLFWKRKQL